VRSDRATAELVARTRAGDGDAFAELAERHRRELEVHCYRILGSTEDAKDATQETLASAWRAIGNFKGNASIRTWLYRIATNNCLDALRSPRRRLEMTPRFPQDPQPNSTSDVMWLEPYPDALLEGLADAAPGPDARLEQREAISLAFITALQLLPPKQRVVLVLRDVLGFRAKEVAEMLNATEESVSSALKRARSTLQQRLPSPDQPVPGRGSGTERELVQRFVRAYESGDVQAVVALLSKDAVLTTPLSPAEFSGRELCERFLEVAFQRTYRLIPTRANGQPGFGVYVNDPLTGVARATGMLLLTLVGDRITRITHFDNSVLTQFGLPRTIPRNSPDGAI
jgi:RNA polymerase sigma-70 factor (ECF subfamily)